MSDGNSSGAEGEFYRIPLCVVRNGVVSALGGWSEPSWGSVDPERGNGLALVTVGSELASPFEKWSDYHLEEGR